MKHRYDAVLLDIDGTIVDSNDAHAAAWVAALAEHGRPLPFDRVRPLIGMGGDKLLATALSIDHESPDGKAISASRSAVFKRDHLPTLKPTHGGERFVQW